MTSYISFLKKYKTCQSETEQLATLKEFMFSLPPDEFVAWMSEGTNSIERALKELMKSGNPEDLQFAKNYIQNLETILQKDNLLGKAA